MGKQCEKCAKSYMRTLEKLDEYERKLADGELVSKEWHDEQVGHLELEVEWLKKQNEELAQANIDLWNANQCGVRFNSNKRFLAKKGSDNGY